MLNETIKAARKKKGLSQEELAVRLHVVRQTVSKWEQGASVPDAGMLIRLAEALGTTVSALLGEETAAPEPPDSVSVQQLAQKLEALNGQLAARAERSRKRRRAVFVLIAVLALWGGVTELLGMVSQMRFSAEIASSPAIIGGADEATSIFVSSVSPRQASLFLTAAAGIAAVLGLWFTRRR